MTKCLIALDLDGTLTNARKEVTPRTRQALTRAIEAGAAVVLASGRPTYGIVPVAECLNLKQHGGYMLAFNGGKIVDCRTDEDIYSKNMPDAAIPYIYKYACEHGYALLGYKGSNILTEMPDDEYVKEESRINKMNIVRVNNLLEALPAHSTKLLMTGEPTLMVQAEKDLQQMLGETMDVYRSAPFFLELVARGIDKAQSLQMLLSRLHLPPSKLIAFGDGYNDISMIRLAGRGIAMANAAPEVRAAADEVTLSNEEDGVAAVIERMLEDELK